ncbi:MAG: enoyl-CoA hydratase/isomerase family protein, partial [Desulfatirhabdiaceae bacterium]
MKFIDIEVDGKILAIWINNPPNNYLPGQFFVELDQCRRDHMASDAIDAVIISARGRTFSKGADIQEIKSGSGKIDLETVRFGNEVFTGLTRLNKPVIAAVNGPCFGGGLELALC